MADKRRERPEWVANYEDYGFLVEKEPIRNDNKTQSTIIIV